MPTANINGQSIAYEDTGGDGPALIFSHGFLMDRTMFDAQLESFRENFRCITWDERGFGDTPADAPFSYWDSADDVVALMDYLEIEQAVLLGMSQGGFLSLRAALKNPDRVRALVLIDSGVHIDPPEVLEAYKQMTNHWMSEEPLGEVGVNVAGIIIGEPELSNKWIGIWESRDRYSLKYPAEALLSRDDITDRVSEISCPILVVHGEEDNAIPIETAEAMSARLQDCRGLIRVPGAAHAANMTHPEIVNPAIALFLEGLD
ncbi:MAG: alpha/beta hydrolase [SAR86 cluster bacterium]|uniref:Alpha/beta hydrolase n=1 Tax=SAR86 cluster bacterium TaxID=2030880 RepID=A0A2A5AMD9_9GAMM|nr:MAG: alpha/beta hydrolase [SAR86 cluster bacterium]